MRSFFETHEEGPKSAGDFNSTHTRNLKKSMQQQVHKYHHAARVSSCSSTRCVSDASPIRYVPQRQSGLIRVPSSSVIFPLDNGFFCCWWSPSKSDIFALSPVEYQNHARVSPFRNRDPTREHCN